MDNNQCKCNCISDDDRIYIESAIKKITQCFIDSYKKYPGDNLQLFNAMINIANISFATNIVDVICNMNPKWTSRQSKDFANKCLKNIRIAIHKAIDEHKKDYRG